MRAAKRNMSTLRKKKYFEETRRGVEVYGNAFCTVLRRFPCLLATVAMRCDAARHDALLRSGHREACNYANVKGGGLYRCPSHGCGGAAINSSCASRVAGPHFRPIHRELEVVLALRLELRRAWGIVRIPELEGAPVGSTGFGH